MNRRLRSTATAIVFLAAAPVLLTLPAVVAGIDGLVPFLAAVASLYLGLQFACGDLTE